MKSDLWTEPSNSKAAPAQQRQGEETWRALMLYEMVRDLASQQELIPLLDSVVERAIAFLDAPSGFFYLYDADQNEFEVAANRELAMPRGTRVSADRGLSGFVIHTREPMIVDDFAHWDRRRPEFAALPITSILEVPIIFGVELLGVLGVCHTEPGRRFTDADAQRLFLFSYHIASLVHNAQLYSQVCLSRERLQILSYQLLKAQETERRNIARELHDEIGQVITSVQMSLQSIESRLSDPALQSSLDECTRMLERLLQQVRDLSLDLRPSLLDDLGLVPALRWYIERQSKRSGLVIEFDGEPPSRRLPAEIETVCFRVTQEAITNIIRHARATHAWVSLQCQRGELELTIRDDGVGFDVEKAVKQAMGGASMGILGLQERVLFAGGRFAIESMPAHGTRVKVCLPVPPDWKRVERRAKRRLA